MRGDAYHRVLFAVHLCLLEDSGFSVNVSVSVLHRQQTL